MIAQTDTKLRMALKRWSLKLNRIFGMRINTIGLFVIIALLVSLFQICFYLALTSHTIYCQLPNLRHQKLCNIHDDFEGLPTIYVVTPTYARHVQKAELTRLSHTLMLVPKLQWLIVEDSNWETESVSKLVWRLKNIHQFSAITHLYESTPAKFKLKPGDPSWKYPKGVWQRNKAISWIRQNLNYLDSNGVVYFADDDNTYDLELFNEMRFTQKVSIWPVGLAGGLLVERPIVSDGKVQGFNSMWKKRRPFPIDMSGFAISLRTLADHPGANFSDSKTVGFLESHFVGQFVDSWADLEPKAQDCKRLLVWHTKTQNPSLHEERKLARRSNDGID